MDTQSENKERRVPVITVRHSIRNQLPLLAGIIFLWLFAVYLSIELPFLVARLFRIPLLGADVTLSFFAIFPLLGVMMLVHRLLNERIILRPDYVLFREGLLSWRELSSRIEYEHVREVNIGQSIYQKLVNVGDVKVSTVATQIASEVTMPGVSNPRALKDEIYKRRHEILTAREHELAHELHEELHHHDEFFHNFGEPVANAFD